MKVSIERQISCVKREIMMRERVYPRLVKNKRMSEKVMQEELEAMKAVLETLKRADALLTPEEQKVWNL